MRILLLTLASAAICEASIVDQKFVTAVAVSESRMLNLAIGDNGESRGAWQMSERAWDQVSAARRLRGATAYDWSTYCSYEAIARDYATEYLRWVESRLAHNMKRQPTRSEIYAAWNLGVTGFARLGYRLAAVPSVTKRGIARLSR